MKYILLAIVLLSFNPSLYSQIQYEEGYFIDNSGNRSEVLILNKDWRDNPSEIKYKKNRDGELLTAGLEDIKEFGIGDYVRYQKYLTAIDESKDQIKNLSGKAEPQFVTSTVFLKQLVAGETALYSYRKGVLQRFFYVTEGKEPEPLVYKRYKNGNKVATNNSYRQQLYSNLNCQSLPADAFRNIAYNKEDLVEYFVNHNTCENNDYRVIEDERNRKQYNLYIKGGIQFSSINVERGLEAKGADLSFNPALVIGVEAEYVMPFNRNKWALFIEPTYQNHTVERKLVNSTPYDFYDAYLTMDFQFISATAGLRHYSFINESSKLFVAGMASFDLPINTKILLDRGDRYVLKPELDGVTTSAYFSGGLGYNYSNRFSAEIRYYFSKNTRGAKAIPSNYDLEWDANINSIALILGYRFL